MITITTNSKFGTRRATWGVQGRLATLSCAKFHLTRRTSRLTRPRAFSLIEIMVVVALLTVIILGLLAMFDQTERAFRLGLSQTDILESGRTVTDMIGRELSQMTPCDGSAYPLAARGATYPPNFWVVNQGYSYQSLPGQPPTSGMLSARRTNVLEDVLFLIRNNQTWSGIGYFVRAESGSGYGVGRVGTLYRFQTNCTYAQLPQRPPIPGGSRTGTILDIFKNVVWAPTNPAVSKIMDGVVDFKVRAFAPKGYWITNDISSNTNATRINIFAGNSLYVPGEVDTYFYSNAVPAFVELEIGVLERKPLQQYNSIPSGPAQASFFANQAAHVHIFRQRIAIPNVDPAAYPTNIVIYAPY